MLRHESHPEFADQVRAASVREFLRVADDLAGERVGFFRDRVCRDCGHDWPTHTLFMLQDPEQTAGYVSCPVPSCGCSTTWGFAGAVPPPRCQMGLAVRTDEAVINQCPLPAGGELHLAREAPEDGVGEVVVPMCTEHLMAMPATEPGGTTEPPAGS